MLRREHPRLKYLHCPHLKEYQRMKLKKKLVQLSRSVLAMQKPRKLSISKKVRSSRFRINMMTKIKQS